MLSRHLIPTPIEHFLAEHLDDASVLCHPALDKTIRLNQTATLIWDLCDGKRTLGEIGMLLAASFPGEPQRVFEDVEIALQHFAREGALTLRC